MRKYQQLSEDARALIRPCLFIEAAFIESTVTVMTAGAVWVTRRWGSAAGFFKIAGLPEKPSHL